MIRVFLIGFEPSGPVMSIHERAALIASADCCVMRDRAFALGEELTVGAELVPGRNGKDAPPIGASFRVMKLEARGKIALLERLPSN